MVTINSKKNNLDIIYLGTEGNLKSCLGLEEILRDGWNVKLVVGYVPDRQTQGNQTIQKHLVSLLFSAIQLVTNIRRQRKANSMYRTMRNLLSSFDFQLILTSDKSLKSVYKILKTQGCDVLLSNGWQYKIIPKVFQLAKIEALNCHSSYLPEYRGGNVTYAPLINQEKESGVTVHTIVKEFDAGMILAQERVIIEKGETPTSLNAKRAKVTGKALITALTIAGEKEKYKSNPISPFYHRCSYKTYLKYKFINSLRTFLGLKIRRYEPVVRDDL